MEYLHDGARHRVLSSREIILSSGAIGSPQLLMLSGIGDRKELEALDIDVVHHLPAVGKYLRDHVFTHTVLTLNESVALNAEEFLTRFGAFKAATEWYIFGTGMPLSGAINGDLETHIPYPFSGPLSHSGIELTGFFNTGATKDSRPDLQLYMCPVNPFLEDLYKIINMKPEVRTTDLALIA